MGHHRNVRGGSRKAAVVTPAVDRACVADSRPACHCDMFIEAEANDNVWPTAARRAFRVDEPHAQGSGNVSVSITHEDRAELQAALETHHGGFDRVRVTIGDEQVVAPRVRRHNDAAGGNGLRHYVPRRSVGLRLTTHGAIRVVLRGVKVGTVEHDAGQRWYVATTRTIVSLQAIESEQCRRPHETGHGVPIRVVRADTALGNTAEGEMSDITRDGAVIVILRDDDVSGLLPP